MSTTQQTQQVTRVYRVFIRASPEAIWQAITDPEWTRRYGYAAISNYDLRPGGAFSADATPEMQQAGMPEHVVDGEVVEADPPRRLVQTWRFLWSEEIKAEGAKRLTWEIEESPYGMCRLTVTHELDGAPLTLAQVDGDDMQAGGGWPFILSDLKTLLETGGNLAGQ
jgi:uncharacterized protein YndB with AHSA1/START domain